MNRMMKLALTALLLLALAAPAFAQEAVLLVDLPEDAVMVESIEFENGDFIQTYQLASGVSVQLIRYVGFSMTLEELIASDWPVNCGVRVMETTEISGYPARHAHVWQVVDESGYPVKADESGELKDGQQMMEIDLVLVTVDDATLIYQDTYLSGQRGDETIPLIESLKVQGAENAEVG